MTDPFEIGDLVAIVLWTSLALSLIVVTLGVQQKSQRYLIISAILSVPFSFVLAGNPGARFFIVMPALHLLAIPALKATSPWPARLVLLAIYGLIGWFFALSIPAWLSQEQTR